MDGKNEVTQMLDWQRSRLDTLTEREREIARYAACGLRNHEIASRMTLNLSTVRTYMQWVFVKLGVRSRVQLTLVALLVGLIDSTMVVALWQQYAPEACGPNSEVIGCD